jgi:hypothetical protein
MKSQLAKSVQQEVTPNFGSGGLPMQSVRDVAEKPVSINAKIAPQGVGSGPLGVLFDPIAT